MDTSPPSYRRSFWTSPHHLWLAAVTIGGGFATGEPLGLIVGAVAYALGWVFLPDAAFYRKSLDARSAAAHQKALASELAAFRQQQESLQRALSDGRKRKYDELDTVCEDIKKASQDGPVASDLDLETRWRKLDELRYTFLRMLSVEQSLAAYLELERKEQLPTTIRTLDEEVAALMAEVAALKQVSPPSESLAGKERLLTSRLERLSALNQRHRRVEQAKSNHDLLIAEQERLLEQAKLIRADAIASRNPDRLTARIDLSIEHLAATNQWLTELADFRDSTEQLLPQGAIARTLSDPNPRLPKSRSESESQP